MKDLLPQMFLLYPAIWQMNLVQPQHHIRTLTFKSLSSLWDLGKCKERVCIDGSKYIWQFSCTNCHIGKMPYTFWLWQFSPMGIFLGILQFTHKNLCQTFSAPTTKTWLESFHLTFFHLNSFPGQIAFCWIISAIIGSPPALRHNAIFKICHHGFQQTSFYST